MSRSAQGSISSLCSRTRPPVRRHPATAPSTTTSPPATCWTRCRIRGAARRVFNALLENHPNEKVAANTLFVLEELRKQLESERDRLSQQVFANLLEAGTMRFIVVTDDLQFNRLPVQIESPATERQANREDGSQYQRSLFERTGEGDLNGLENKVATYLDRQARLFFWYRNRTRKDYYVQG